MKEPILAIVIGFVVGLVITFGIWTANKSLKQAQITTPSPTAEPTLATGVTSPVPSSAPVSGLTIAAPDNEAVLSSASTKLTGSAPANSVIVVSGGKNEQIFQSDDSGQFSTEIDLESGYNLITVTSFDAKGTAASKTLTLTYTTAKI